MSAPRIGLALGGGSARGLAHIPMLEVFDEMGLKPSVIAGCSIGAMIGAAYASGMPAKDIGRHARKVLANRLGAMRYVFGDKRARFTDLLALKSFGSMQLNGERLVALALPDGVAARVEETVIPFKVITTDFLELCEHVIESGPMIQAVAASIAIPGIISAPAIAGRLHVDGGVTNPVPFNHVREGSDIVVAIDVTGRPKPIRGKHASNLELAIGSMLIMFNQIAELRHSLAPTDIYVEPPISGFNSGEFFRAEELMDASARDKDKLKRALEEKLKQFSRKSLDESMQVNWR